MASTGLAMERSKRLENMPIMEYNTKNYIL